MKRNRWTGMKIIKNCKKRGEWVELVFAVRAIKLGLHLAKPWGESSGYDFTVDLGARIVRVQVKSTTFKEGAEGYSCTLKDSKGPYKKNTFDFVAAYVIPEDVWFIFPEKVVRGMWSVGLYPKLKTAKYREYQEACIFCAEDRRALSSRFRLAQRSLCCVFGFQFLIGRAGSRRLFLRHAPCDGDSPTHIRARFKRSGNHPSEKARTACGVPVSALGVGQLFGCPGRLAPSRRPRRGRPAHPKSASFGMS